MKKWWISIVAVVAVILIWQSVSLYRSINADQAADEARAERTAQEEYGLSTVDSVDYYHGKKSFEVVKGTSTKNGKVYLFVDSKNKAKVVKQSDGLTKKQMQEHVEKQLNPKKWINLRLGMEDDQVLWEAVYLDSKGRYTFYYGYYENGERYKKYSMKQEV